VTPREYFTVRLSVKLADKKMIEEIRKREFNNSAAKIKRRE